MLQNRIYRGEIAHRDQTYPGEHDPIVDDDVSTTQSSMTIYGRGCRLR